MSPALQKSTWSLAALAKNPEKSFALKAKLEALPDVDKALTLNDFVPEDQDEKLEVLDQLALTLGPELHTTGTKAPPNPGEKTAALRQFLATLSAYLATHSDAGDALAGFRLDTCKHGGTSSCASVTRA